MRSSEDVDEGGSGNMEKSGGYVEFGVGGEHFAVSLGSVREIVRACAITPIPSASAHVKGMIALRDEVLPVVDLASRLGMARDPEVEGQIVILDLQGIVVGLLVDEASQVSSLGDAEFDAGAAPQDPGRKGLVAGVLRTGERLLMLLDPEAVLSIDPETLRRLRDTASREKRTEKETERDENLFSVVTFTLGNDVYGFPLEDVREIIRPSRPALVPEAPPHVRGVINVRGSILPVVDLGMRLGVSSGGDASEGAKIVVLDYGRARTGFLVDGIREVLEVSRDMLQEPPAVTRTAEGRSVVSGILDVRGQIIALLDKQVLVSSRELDLADVKDAAAGAGGGGKERMRTFVVFLENGQEFGLPIGTIREITRRSVVAPLPGVPAFVEGVMSIRGESVTVVSLRKRFGGDVHERGEESRILVANVSGVSLGFLVDSVVGVEQVPEDRLAPPPLGGVDFGEAGHFVSAVGHLEGGRLLLVLDAEAVFGETARNVETTVPAGPEA
jgi:purine-binding chemotaxis protein CheW